LIDYVQYDVVGVKFPFLSAILKPLPSPSTPSHPRKIKVTENKGICGEIWGKLGIG
jgi:hypothetical protein